MDSGEHLPKRKLSARRLGQIVAVVLVAIALVYLLFVIGLRISLTG